MLDFWRVIKNVPYARGMGKHTRTVRVSPVNQPADLREYAGRWVAVKNERVVAVAKSSLDLVTEVQKLGVEGRGAVAQYVAPHSDAIVIGVG